MLQRRLCAVAACALLGLATAPAQADDTGFANPHLLTTAEELADLLAAPDTDDLRIVDVRSAEAFADGHLPTAVNIPFTALTDPNAHVEGALRSDDALAELFGQHGIDARSQVVLYDDRGGFRASRLFWVMEYFGHRDVSLLDGGIQAWADTGAALATTAVGTASELPPDTVFAVNLTPRRHASADWIMQRRDDAETVVVDVRPTAAYEAGHIPWAVSVPWSQSLDDSGRIADVDLLRTHFEAHGVTPDAAIIVHCQTGEAAAHTYFVLRLMGHSDVRTYHRSWAEWGATDDLPKTLPEAG